MSLDEAAIIFSRNTSLVSDSTVAAPYRARPNARCTHCHAGGHLPPGHDTAGREYRNIADRFDGAQYLGNQHQRRNFAAMTPGFAALSDQEIDARMDLANGVFLGADQRAYGHAMLLAAFNHHGRRNAQRVGDEPDGVTECDLEELFGNGRHR